ncbi:methylated-DNA--[protein]-cysteine S-methyltransferase [Sphingomonas cavernae]|uniref:methylated-DNA--[protein]-cysteine S-methyltransferase n=1 Tax=Sphingomonas cavernae TaxID=2320861 RepID=A0A418WSW1_9SPHN|nr:methylated-DNA--[protein]-cysteine S-methyltransferase [Sphingomonas cavernae]RJF94266.1 methylated-DNA--[protein]-cysteine S-methyltransferase [Sphingomonas cavernae]
MTYAPDPARIATPIGIVTICGDDAAITSITIETDPAIRQVESPAAALREAAVQLHAYFAARLLHFDLPLAPAATTRGQALRDGIAAIPFGETLSYGALARQLGSAPRAVGQACARNPFPIVIPCHRVLAAQGQLGAYSGGQGPRTKQWLLTHEQR